MKHLVAQLDVHVRREPKKVAFVIALLLLAAFVWVRQRGGLPAQVAADLGLRGLSAPAPTEPALANLSRGARLLSQWRQRPPVSPVSRNLFASELTTPPPKPAEGSGGAATPTYAEEDGLFWRQLERALSSRADREQYRRELAEAAVADAAKLGLSSIVSGPESRALIGDRLVGVGDRVSAGGEWGAFTVVAIEQRRVILSRRGQRVALTLGVAGAKLLESQ